MTFLDRKLASHHSTVKAWIVIDQHLDQFLSIPYAREDEALSRARALNREEPDCCEVIHIKITRLGEKVRT